ncbi:MAG: hypothetical protein ACFFAN_06365 [Promethearchaeota archaeon]
MTHIEFNTQKAINFKYITHILEKVGSLRFNAIQYSNIKQYMDNLRECNPITVLDI